MHCRWPVPNVRCICYAGALALSPHPAVVQVDQPARHAQQHNAAAVVPAQAALRPRAMLRYVAAQGGPKVAARHVLRPALAFSQNLLR